MVNSKGVNLSDYWRTDKSLRQGLELLSVMRGAKGAVSLMGGQYAVQWGYGGSYSSSRTKTIALDIGVLDKIPRPYPGKAVDVVIGLALHEAGHEKWSQPYDKLKEWKDMITSEREAFMDVANILEDAYVDHMLRGMSPALAGYIRGAREALVSPDAASEVEKLAIQPPTKDNMSAIWATISLFDVAIPSNMNPELRKVLLELLQVTQKYLKIKGKAARLRRAYETWRDIISGLPSQSLQPPPPPDKQPLDTDDLDMPMGDSGKGKGEEEEGENEGEQEEGEQEEEEEGEGKLAPSEEEDKPGEDEDESEDEGGGESVAEQIRNNLLKTAGATYGQTGLLNLSTVLQNRTISAPDEDDEQALANATHNEQVMRDMEKEGVGCSRYVEFDSTYDAEGFNKVLSSTQKEIREMRRAFDILEDVNARWRKGLKEGKLDSRRLSKVGCGKDTVFKHRDFKAKASTAICLLLDVSGSMNSQMGIVAEVACIFSLSLRTVKGVWYSTYSYCSDNRGEVVMTKMSSSIKPLSLKDVYSSGGTPSGLALSSAILHLKHRPEKRKLVIHFTDGSPDNPDMVKKALEIADKHHVEILNISSHVLQEGLYKNTKRIYKISDLPRVVMEMLKEI